MKTKLAAAAVMLVVAGTARAEDVRGVVGSVDPERGQVTVQLRGRGAHGLSLAFTLTNETAIEVGHQPATVADLRPGTRVRVLYEARDGRRFALAIAARAPLGVVIAAKPGAAAASTAPADPNATVGSLQRVALSDREIVVVGPAKAGLEEETTFVVPESAAVTRDGKSVKLEDLKEGEHVSVRGEKKDGKMVASAVAAGAPPASDPARTSRVERIRRFLQTADYFLQQISEGQGGPQK